MEPWAAVAGGAEFSLGVDCLDALESGAEVTAVQTLARGSSGPGWREASGLRRLQRRSDRAAAKTGGAPSDTRRTDALPRPAGEGRGEGEDMECRVSSEERSEPPHVASYEGQKESFVPHDSGDLEPA